MAIPTIQRSLHLSVAGLEWVVSGYVLVFAGLMLVGGRLADVYGRRRVFLAGLSVFTLSSLAAGLASSGGMLIAFRALQGLDGALADHRSSLGASIATTMRRFDPDTIITFGADGGHGHPDHAAISGLTTQGFRRLARDHNRGQRLYHAVFPPRHTSMAEELADRITDSGQRATDLTALQAIALFAGESATMRLARDDVRVQWFSPGTWVTEQGEPANALYLILSGTADRLLEQPGGQVTHQRRMQAGDFFGELGLVAGVRPAYVVARDSLTCLVLSRTPVTPYAGRGTGATGTAESSAAAAPPGTCAVDVTSHLHRKLAALARHRTQYPIVPSMLPHSMLQKMLGTEFFHRIGSWNAAVSRCANAPHIRRPPDRPSPRYLRRHRGPGNSPAARVGHGKSGL